jgi:hypothetical protein
MSEYPKLLFGHIRKGDKASRSYGILMRSGPLWLAILFLLFVLFASVSPAPAASGWWDANYQYRKKVTFGTNHSVLPLGYTVSVTMDTRASAHVALTSGNDVRVVWQPTAGGNVELDRIGNTWNSATTNIDFRLQSQVGANLNEALDGSYYIYYGYASAGTPPTNEMNVYYFADFFNRANNTTVGNGWTEWNTGGGDVSIATNQLSVIGNNAGPPDAGIKQNFPLGAIPGNFTLSFDWTMPTNTESIWTHYVNIGNSATMIDGSRTQGVGPGIYVGEGAHFVPDSQNYNVSNNLAGNMETGVNGGPYTIRMVVNASAQTYDYYRGGVLRASSLAYVTAQTTLDQIRIATDQYSAGQPAYVYDNLKVVLNVATAPTTALGTEEQNTAFLNQLHYRWRQDNGPESSGPAWKVQSYQGNMGAQPTLVVPITSVTSLNRAFILAPAGNMSVGRGSVNGNQNANEVLVRANFTALNQVTLTRGSNANDSYYSFYIVENVTGGEINVKSGTNTFATTDTQLDINVGSGIADYTKTAVFLTVSSGDASRNYYNEARVRGYMTSNINLTLRRTGGNSSVTVDWFVVEFIGSGWSVQQGDFSLMTGTQTAPQTQTISAVTPAQTLVFMNWSADTNGLDQTSAKVELFDATTLRFSRRNTTAGTVTCRYFVVSHSSLSVQRGSASAATADASVSQTITSVDTTQAFPITFSDCSGTGSNFPRPYWRAWLSNSTTLYWDRAYTGQASNFLWQVISLSGFSSVGADFAAAEDTKLVGLDKGIVQRLRFLVANTGGQGSGAVTYQLQVAQTSTCGSGVYSAVPTDTSGQWQIVYSTYIIDGQATSNISPGLTDPVGGTFVAGQSKDAGNTTGSITLSPNQFTEIEFSIVATNNAIYGADYCFRLYNSAGGKPLDTYSAYAAVSLAARFSYRKAITIDHTKVSCGSMTDFPVLVKITGDNNLKTAPTGHVTNSNGYDIIFRDSDGTTTLDHEIEQYNGTNGDLVAWVRIPTLTNTADKVIYMYYGNSSIITSTTNPTAVWDSNYKGVWHLKEDQSGTGTSGLYKDSTSNGYNGDDYVSATGKTGKIASGQQFDGSNDYVGMGNVLDYGKTDPVTYSAWIKTSGTYMQIAGKANPDPASWQGVWFFIEADGGLSFYLYDLAGNYKSKWSTNTFNDNQWHYVVATYDGSNSANGIKLYEGGSEILNMRAIHDNTLGTVNNSYPFNIGADNNGSYSPFNGYLDEVRLSSTARSACWIQTEYNNQMYPNKAVDGANGFVTVGTEVATPPTAVTLLSLSAKGDGNRVLVEWATGQEVDNLGFNLYRSPSPNGPFTRLNDALILASLSVRGNSYTFTDSNVTRGNLYYYELEDIDIYGVKTMHGPVCVDWNGDGMPDDGVKATGLNAGMPVGQGSGGGLTNLSGETCGGNPQVAGGEATGADVVVSEAQTLGKGIEVISSDQSGATLELRTEAFDMAMVEAGGVTYQRVRVLDYIHGFTSEVGKPELPVKGVILDVPQGKTASLSVEGTESQVYNGYWIYPVPEKQVSSEGGMERVVEEFRIDPGLYASNAFYPDMVAQLGQSYTFRGQQRIQVLFYPLHFNPGTKELVQYNRIRVRVDYEGSEAAAFARSIATPQAASPNPMSSAVAWAPPSVATPSYKVKVEEEGIYRLTKTWLASQGIDVSPMLLSQLRMYNLGQEVPIHVYDQNGNNVFDAEDYIEFYGQKVPSPQSKYTKYNVYWLTTSGGSGAPMRMGNIDGTPGSGSQPATYTSTAHEETDDVYLLFIPGDDTVDRWYNSSFVYGTGITGTPTPEDVDFTVGVPGLGGSMRGTLKLSMCGLVDMDHDVEVLVNGVSVRRYTWSGITFSDDALSGVDVGLADGNNTVTLRCYSGTDPANPDGVVLDWIEVVCPRRFEAENNQLKFSYTIGSRYQVTGFNGDSFLAYDITSPSDVKEIANFQMSGSGPYTMEMEPRSGSGQRTYLVLGTDQVKSPVSIVQDTPSNLASTSNGADYILITHRDLGWDASGTPYPWLDGNNPSSIVSLRQGQGMRVKVVDVEDIYDEFGYGVVGPQAIRDFLTYAYQTWVAPAPKYVLLVGDGTYDAKDNMGLGTVNFIPTYLTFTPGFGQTGTDEWYGRVSGNDMVADMYIGRLPAATVDQASRMVAKIVNYEKAANSKTWEKNVLLVADRVTEPYETDFEMTDEDAAGYIPAGMNAPLKEYLGNYALPSDLTTAITQEINNDGALVVNYSGHGSVQLWSNEHIFSNDDVGALTNGSKLPFFVGMTCLTGYFLEPEASDFLSMAEVLLRSGGGGGVAALMSTGMTDTAGQHVLDASLFDGIFVHDMRVLGDAISYAKQQVLANGAGYEDVSTTFLLFGDPAMRLKVPLPTMPSGVVVQVVSGEISLSWQRSTDCNGNGVVGYNVYRSTTPGSDYTKVNGNVVTGASFVDGTPTTGTWFYVVKSVDGDGVESAASQEVSVTVGSREAGGSTGGGGGGGGCFISTITN